MISRNSLPYSVQKKLIKVIKSIKPREIWLFGSYAKGTPTHSSDVDIFIVKKKLKDDLHKDVVNLRNELGKFQRKYDMDIDIFIDTKINIKEKIANGDPFYTSIFADAEKIYSKKESENKFMKMPPKVAVKFRIFKRKLSRILKKVN